MPLLIYAVGTKVTLVGAGSGKEGAFTLGPNLNGSEGVVASVDQQRGAHDVQLQSGILVKNLTAEYLILTALVHADAPEVEQVYAPFATSPMNQTMAQAGRLRDALVKCDAMAATVTSWAEYFWQSVTNEDAVYGLTDDVRRPLQAHGYIGAGSKSPPRVEELKRELSHLATAGGPSKGASSSTLPMPESSGGVSVDINQWHNRLPPSLQRAAPEIYQSIRSEGVSSVRSWITDQFPIGSRDSPSFQDLFTTATNIDFELAGADNEMILMQKLATSDALEIGFRKLGAYIYQKRTGDKTGAARLLAIRTPGTAVDVMPKWAIEDATAFSKSEFQRDERVSKNNKHDYAGGGSGGGGYKGGGQGKKGKGGKGKGKGKGGQGKGDGQAPGTQG